MNDDGVVIDVEVSLGATSCACNKLLENGIATAKDTSPVVDERSGSM